ncbi:SDR family oxidoreductase [Pedobacter sp. MC2016-14]|uniref:SDR family oxidoreductase n=1 Tax=Pedobacter sp. MC2016-14 TaxID=2897327 RepID=UPI001E63BA58|nr:SDR family oxidoreductase [Pedobacter sp. MC2016-14]MCD0488651.1 SDR family oxidoreductase [Pedobacter sp. MC2016-14]
MESSTKIALVTGGSRGLGKNMALAIANKGIDVVITYNSKKEEAEEVVAEIRQLGRKAAALQLSVGEVKTFDSFISELKTVLADTFSANQINFLINNAGIGINAAFAETTEEQFDALLNIQFKGVFFLTQKALAIIADGGRIVNISTGLARFATPGYAAYASMKGAIETLTKYQAKELGAKGIAVNVVAPGAIETDFGGGMVRDNEHVNKHLASVTSLGRVGLPDDIGGVVAFLCTEEARWINAQRIEVSGGMFL